MILLTGKAPEEEAELLESSPMFLNVVGGVGIRSLVDLPPAPVPAALLVKRRGAAELGIVLVVGVEVVVDLHLVGVGVVVALVLGGPGDAALALVELNLHFIVGLAANDREGAELEH